MANQLLLIEDVDDLGRSGDVVSVRPGYARNFLLPQKKAVVADKFTLRLQERLKKERSELAAKDKVEAEALASSLEGVVVEIRVKVDPDGHMYGSVAAVDVAKALETLGHAGVEKRHVLLPHPLKTIGEHSVVLKLKEGVPAKITVKIESDMPAVQG